MNIDKKNEFVDKIYRFWSLKVTTYSVELSKIALWGDDDKRSIMDDKIQTLALGHNYTINNQLKIERYLWIT